MQDEEDTGYHSYFMQTEPHHHEDHTTMNIMAKDFFEDKNDFIMDCDMKMQDEEPGDLATVLAMTQNELDQAHEIFMITVDQQLTPEEMLVWRPEELGVPETDLDRRFRFGQYSLSGNTWKACGTETNMRDRSWQLPHIF